ncbi:hypothetical protein M0812_04048 [Anaeramoeba flamelloides]|uniref:Uncharacterized protein n=1 Tax=Anaeramoeba flamelloides TaxID=1746091 RepID=A0AAV8AF75_9EUKA|nr:hypothetical protein M0812_04048 [Anaeramoeba flamelloides]
MSSLTQFKRKNPLSQVNLSAPSWILPIKIKKVVTRINKSNLQKKRARSKNTVTKQEPKQQTKTQETGNQNSSTTTKTTNQSNNNHEETIRKHQLNKGSSVGYQEETDDSSGEDPFGVEETWKFNEKESSSDKKKEDTFEFENKGALDENEEDESSDGDLEVLNSASLFKKKKEKKKKKRKKQLQEASVMIMNLVLNSRSNLCRLLLIKKTGCLGGLFQ